jgi:hypothetical protein
MPVLAIFVVSACLLAAVFPVQLSVVAVILFAGPHNWMEARYFAARMPVRWGRQRNFFLLAASGVVALSITFSLVAVDRSVWHSTAALWIIGLLGLIRKELVAAALPIAFLWVAAAWAAPGWADLTLVFLHPTAALWLAYRQISRSRPEWLPNVRRTAMAIVPLALGIVLLKHGTSSPAFGLSFAQVYASPVVVALHAFLELLHYGAWVILLPSIGLASAPWDFSRIPLVRHREGWPRLVKAILIAGVGAVVLLWIFFLLDYRATRDVYFTLAIVHVLAEVPFLMWLR